FLGHNYIRLRLTLTKTLQTVIRFPRETRRRSTALKSNAFILNLGAFCKGLTECFCFRPFIKTNFMIP
ncbi:MAG: hypothetical protein PVJ87_09610, partial [Desulfobacterales bacterium]